MANQGMTFHLIQFFLSAFVNPVNSIFYRFFFENHNFPSALRKIQPSTRAPHIMPFVFSSASASASALSHSFSIISSVTSFKVNHFYLPYLYLSFFSCSTSSSIISLLQNSHSRIPPYAKYLPSDPLHIVCHFYDTPSNELSGEHSSGGQIPLSFPLISCDASDSVLCAAQFYTLLNKKREYSPLGWMYIFPQRLQMRFFDQPFRL